MLWCLVGRGQECRDAATMHRRAPTHSKELPGPAPAGCVIGWSGPHPETPGLQIPSQSMYRRQPVNAGMGRISEQCLSLTLSPSLALFLPPFPLPLSLKSINFFKNFYLFI